MILQRIDQSVGNTPLIEIGGLTRASGARILAKAEFFNPTGSVKDRIASFIISQAIERGEIGPDTVVIEPTSGNTGIGLAAVCAARGLRLILTMPESMSPERRALLRHLGAELILTPASEGMNGAIDEARRLSESFDEVYRPDQFANPDNPLAHYRSTGPEIWRQCEGRVDAFVAAVGTGGTLTGTGRYLREHDPRIAIVAVEPERSAFLSRKEAGPHAIQGIGAGFAPAVLDRSLIDEIVTVEDEEAFAFARQAAAEEGLLCGISSGANLAAAFRLACRPEYRGRQIVTVLPDTAERYLSTPLFDPA